LIFAVYIKNLVFSWPEGLTYAMPGVIELENMFCVEMRSKRHVKSISISDEAHERVLFEGNLGELLEASLVEADVLEFIGVNGVLRVGLTMEQLRKTLKVTSQVEPQLRGGELQSIQEGVRIEMDDERKSDITAIRETLSQYARAEVEEAMRK